MLFLSDGSTHADLVAMAQEDYNLDMNTESVELTYSLQQMAPYLPPIHVTSDRQVRNLLEISKTHEVRLAVDDLHGSLLVNAETYMEMMCQLHAVYGEWLLKDGCWNFVVDHFKGARMLFLSEGSTHADLVAMAQDDYNLDMNTESVELTYSLQQSLYFVRRLPGSLLEDLLEVVWKTSWKLPGNRLEDFWEVV
ncbi:hypothetical protein DY000_02040281 [Brassica cretica]|uniref:Uncharacterized protein n=1 Tax=Brassica cretica TaxID=69181 RepID=A0ABQ7BML0_BRACR|nr:hypothetical protein DY000_02040281 [Brassica cretica]